MVGLKLRVLLNNQGKAPSADSFPFDFCHYNEIRKAAKETSRTADDYKNIESGVW